MSLTPTGGEGSKEKKEGMREGKSGEINLGGKKKGQEVEGREGKEKSLRRFIFKIGLDAISITLQKPH